MAVVFNEPRKRYTYVLQQPNWVNYPGDEDKYTYCFFFRYGTLSDIL